MSSRCFDSIAAVGDVADVNAWSGIPYHFLQATARAGWKVEPWRLALDRFGTSRKIWNARQWLLGRGIGGFQYSPAFLDAAERQISEHLFSGRVLTFNQHFPRAASVARRGGKLIHYIDAPFAALVRGQGLDLRLPRWIRDRALALERENYAASERVICMARWAADAVVELCGVPHEKVSVVLPGANLELPSDFVPRSPAGVPGRDRPLILGFVGRDWQRKGLPFLVDVARGVAALGLQVRVRCVGDCPPHLQSDPLVEYLGVIDKRIELERFIAFLSSCDLGCLFSEREALGISTLEFLRVGVPVAGFAHEGLADTLLDGASLGFQLSADSTSVAAGIAAAIRSEEMLRALQSRAIGYSAFVGWDRCLSEISRAFGT